MLKILVAGAIEQYSKSSQDFAVQLGRQIAKQEHILFTGCLNEFDRLVAEGASNWLLENGLDVSERIRSYILSEATPSHSYGVILRSQLSDWNLTHHQLYIPEQIRFADVVVLVSGSKGTMCAANWARIANKPVLPVAAFGGAAQQTYVEELKDFDSKYSDRIDQSQYEVLNMVSSDWEKLAAEVISLAERIVSSKNVFVVMSFSNTPQLEDAYESFREVCEEYQYECNRVDNTTTTERIIPEIVSSIENSAFVIADLTEESPNVYYELGFAHGLKKPVIVTARKGVHLPFDIRDIPVIFWEGQKRLKDRLRKKIHDIASLQGR
jgi:predicted Rossmann-fold nucleotide-binding protein